MVVAGGVKQSKTLTFITFGSAVHYRLFFLQHNRVFAIVTSLGCSAVIAFHLRRVTKMSIRGIKYYESQKHAPIFYNLSNTLVSGLARQPTT